MGTTMSDAQSYPRLRVRLVLGSIWSTIRTHWMTLAFLVVVVDFVTWKSLTELMEYFNRFSSATSTDGDDAVSPARRNAEFQLMHFAATFLLLQIVVSSVTLDVHGRLHTADEGWWRAARRILRAKLYLDLLRCLGIAFFLFAIYALFIPILAVVIVSGFSAIPLLIISLILVFVTMLARFCIVVPIVVVEKTRPLRSLLRSWRMTRKYWVKVVMVGAITYILSASVVGLMQFVVLMVSGQMDVMVHEMRSILEGRNSSILWISQVAGLLYITFYAVVLSVLYHYLREFDTQCQRHRDLLKSVADLLKSVAHRFRVGCVVLERRDPARHAVRYGEFRFTAVISVPNPHEGCRAHVDCTKRAPAKGGAAAVAR